MNRGPGAGAADPVFPFGTLKLNFNPNDPRRYDGSEVPSGIAASQ